MSGAFWQMAEDKEITLDCHRSAGQPRVISVNSWYLTSVVNLSFYGFDLTLSWGPLHLLGTSVLHSLLPWSTLASDSTGSLLCLLCRQAGGFLLHSARYRCLRLLLDLG